MIVKLILKLAYQLPNPRLCKLVNRLTSQPAGLGKPLFQYLPGVILEAHGQETITRQDRCDGPALRVNVVTFRLACQTSTSSPSTSPEAAAMWQAPAVNPSVRLPKRARRTRNADFNIASAIL